MSTPASYLQPALSGYNIYRGATSGNPIGQTRAGLGAANLYGKLSGNTNIGTGATGALDLLNLYQGLERGGVSGYGGAAASGMQLAGLLGNNPALQNAGGYLMAPIDLYNEIKGWRSGATGSDALAGGETGFAIGNAIVPGVGGLVGGGIGLVGGALSSLFGPGAKDPETGMVQNVINATSANKNNSNIAAGVQDPYVQLAGLMDEHSSTLPEYQKYGRMGEQAFTDDLVKKLNTAVEANPALAKDPNAAYNQVVAPWVNSMGSGYKDVGPTYTATNQGLLEDMTKQYLSGQAAQDWKAVGGDEPFQNIYQGSPIQGAPQPTAQPIPNSMRQFGNYGRGQLLAAKGGNVKNPELRSRLRKLYEGSFENRKRHYDDGGGVDYFTPSYTNMNYEFNPPSLQEPDVNYNVNDPNSGSYVYPSGGGSAVNASNDPSGYGPPDNSIFGQGGALSSLGSLLGVSSMGQLVQKYGALAPLIAAAVSGGNKPASAPATPAGYGAIPSIATPPNTRSYTQPNVANWYTYGQGPEQSFFSNNQLPNVPGVSPSSAVPASPSSPNLTMQPLGQRPVMAGGGSFNSIQGDDYVPDPGHGDGTSDDVDAKLSGGEYVVDAGTVSMLGNGSNQAGARALDGLRQRVRKHAGKQLVKGKQFMKAKQPQAYLGGKGAA